jgi:GNAT superfamily N-acetyltransferase
MNIEQGNSFVQAFQALPLMRSLDDLYRGFEYWYVNTVVPGVVLGRDQLLLAKDQGRIVGVALGKRSDVETKLRCVRVLPEYEHKGLGIRLIDRMIDVLECEKPHCTVAEEMLHAYSRAFVQRYGFALTAVDKGRYRRGRLEYAFN